MFSIAEADQKNKLGCRPQEFLRFRIHASSRSVACQALRLSACRLPYGFLPLNPLIEARLQRLILASWEDLQPDFFRKSPFSGHFVLAGCGIRLTQFCK